MPLELISSLVSTISTVIAVIIASLAVYSFSKGRRVGTVSGLEAEVEDVRRRI